MWNSSKCLIISSHLVGVMLVRTHALLCSGTFWRLFLLQYNKVPTSHINRLSISILFLIRHLLVCQIYHHLKAWMWWEHCAWGSTHRWSPHPFLGSKSIFSDLKVYSINLLLFSCSGLMMYTQLISLISVRMCSICYPKTMGAK